MDSIKISFQDLLQEFNAESNLKKAEHILLAFFITYHSVSFVKKMSGGAGFKKNLLKSIVRLFTSNKLVQKKLDQTLEEEASKAIASMAKGKALPKNKELPEVGIPHEKLVEMMQIAKKDDLNPYQGKSFAYVYQYSKEHDELTAKAFNMFIHTNVLNPFKFVSLRNMEVEVVQMTASMFNGDHNCVGNVSSGGSESILLAMKAYRDYYVYNNPGCDFKPEVVLCTTAHPAFVKSAKIYNMELVYVQPDANWKMNIEQTKKKINKRTCLIVVSAPQYPHGIVDPIEEISEIGYARNIPVHVDAAIGGFFLPWLEKLGQKFPKFDFRNRGVMSINADSHKFGFAPKGSSVVVFRKSEHRNHYFSVYSEWEGGMYISPTLLGTRNGGSIAAAWASLMAIGKKGFMEVNQKMLEGAQYLKKTVRDVPELELMGDPQGILVSFRTTKASNMNIYHLADCLEERGYHMERQQNPDCIHCTMMMQHYIYREQLSKDIRECVEIVRKNPTKYAGAESSAAMYGMIGQIPDGAIVDQFLCKFLDKVYSFNSSS